MPWGGRGRGFGRGFGYWGWPGNPYLYCRWFPWLPRWWWSGIYGPISPWTTIPAPYPQYTTPYRYSGYPYPTVYGTW